MNRHKKAPVAPTTRALESNVVNDQVNNVMSKNITNVIPFKFDRHEVRTLLIDDQPWFVAKDVIASLEYAKTSNPARVVDHVPAQWKGVNPIHTLGGEQQMLMLSEQGLYFFIGRSDKEKALPFQMWVAGDVLPVIRKHGRYEDNQGRMGTLIGQTIGTDGFHMLGAVVKGKVAGLPKALQRRATSKIWSQAHAAFGVRSAEDIPADQLDSARNFIAAYVVLEGEFIPHKPKEQRLTIHYPIEALAKRRQGMLVESAGERIWLDVALRDLCDIKGEGTPCEELLWELERAGYDIRGAWWELRTYRNKLQSLESWVRGMNCVMDEPQRYAVDMGASA